jgi:hypothetical protein
MEEAARVAFKTIFNAASSLKSVRVIRFVLWDREALEVHERVLADI